jgi:hypothetical protein
MSGWNDSKEGGRMQILGVPGVLKLKTSEESALMELHVKRASAVERTGSRVAQGPTQSIYSDGIFYCPK